MFHMFDDMNMVRYIRLAACVGAYLLLRPYFVKIGARIQEKEYEKQSAAAKDPYEASLKGKGEKKKITPNSLRGGKTVSFKDTEEEEKEASGIQWGKKARQRQKKAANASLSKNEERLREDDEEEKDIMELLVDYDEGEDGW